jgi:hypothetical protein
MAAMDIASKLQIKPGTPVAVLGLPDGVDLGLPEGSTDTSEALERPVIAFAQNRAALLTVAAPAISSARDDRLTWIAYPKAGKLGTDLNRDILARLAEAEGIQPVRQVAIDDTWSALRFRPLD